MTAEQNASLATYLARKVFECSAVAAKYEVKRIAFKGQRNTLGVESDYGGLCEDALVGVIRRALEERGNG